MSIMMHSICPCREPRSYVRSLGVQEKAMAKDEVGQEASPLGVMARESPEICNHHSSI